MAPSNSPASDKVLLVGAAHPYKGGLAQHATRLALELSKRGHQVTVESWKAQYPRTLYPGIPTTPTGGIEIGVPDRVVQKLTWYNPFSWWLAGRRHRSVKYAVFSVPTPFHVFPYLGVLLGLGSGPFRQAIVHNAEPHERRRLDRPFMTVLLRQYDRIIVHNSSERDAAQKLGVPSRVIRVASLPSPWPEPEKVARRSKSKETRFLFFGTIRHYKGLDLLLEAIRCVPSCSLVIAGEFWIEESSVRRAISDLGLEERVTIKAGYVPASELHAVFGASDVLVLPYRSGTGSIVRELGFSFGLPVISTNAGSIAEGIDHDKNGLIVEAGSIPELRSALAAACQPASLERWRRGVDQRTTRAAQLWEAYCSTVIS